MRFSSIPIKFRPFGQNNWLKENQLLYNALTVAAASERHIEPEQERIRELLKLAETQEEVEAREYQIDYIDRYLKRAARLANERLEYFKGIFSPQQINDEVERCKHDKIHWFRYYGWGYDPRPRTSLSTVPFELYPQQEELVHWLDDIVFHRRTSGIIEKARDEGATELCVRWGIHNWNFQEGFSMLLSSRTEDEVDTKKKRGTLFERMRFQIRLLPQWMLDKRFDLSKALLPDKLIAHPNGNTLEGTAPVEEMGRGDRKTCVLGDEFAFWRFAGYPQYRAMSQTTDSIILPSSVAGRLNQFADLAFDNITEKFEMDWRDNPFKDSRWYNSLSYGFISPKMSRTSIAQEVDRNYDAAQPGKVWKLDETLVFITIEEFLRPFEEAGMRHMFFNGEKFRIPEQGRVTRTHDFGQSEGHDWAYLLGWQPKENMPLDDTHFIFVARNLEPTGLTPDQAVKQWRDWEYGFGLRTEQNLWTPGYQPPRNFHSHEQLELRKILLTVYGENWQPWKTDYDAGITTIQDWWTPVDRNKRNPFRPQLEGRCRLVFVAPTGEYELAYNERLRQPFVTMSTSEEGFHTARKQISAYHYAESEMGKAAKAMRPVKDFDDIIDCLVAGTLILTRRGNVPIETVTTDDQVWTREGWKRVLVSAKTRLQVSTYSLMDADGRVISATGNHRVFTSNRGFVPLRGIVVNDTVFVWSNLNLSSLTESNTTATRTQKTGQIAHIFEPVSRMCKKVFHISTLICGKLYADLFRTGIKFITKITTIPTTIFSTLNAFPLRSIELSIERNASEQARPPSLCQQFDLKRNRLEESNQFERKSVKRANNNGSTNSPNRLPVSFVGLLQKAKRLCGSIARIPVNGAITVNTREPRNANVRFAANPSLVTSRPPGSAQTTAVKKITKNAKRVDVYNLTVADCPEYFANGILVHNCVRGYSVMWNIDPVQLSPKERREAALPPNLQNREIIMVNQPTEIQERINLQRVVEFGKIDQQEAANRAKTSKMRPMVPRMPMRRR